MASKRRVRRKACTGKQRHATRQKALDHAFALRRGKGERIEAYKCQFGNHWHIGHQGGKRGRFMWLSGVRYDS